MALTADQVPVAVTGGTPLLRGAPQTGVYPGIVAGSLVPYGTAAMALLPPLGEVMVAIDASTYNQPPSSVPTGLNPIVPKPAWDV